MATRSKHMPWFAALVVTALIVAGGTWFVLDRDTADPVGEPTAAVTSSEDEDDEEPSWLFSQTADGGTFSTDADGVSTLTLTDIETGVIGFTDRPDRDTVVLPVDSFVDAWPTLFADSAPNAVLVEHQRNGDADSFVVVLSDPILDGSSLSFTAEVVEGEGRSDVTGLTATPHTDPPAEFRQVSLFIDDVTTTKMYICYSQDMHRISPPRMMPYPASASAQTNFDLACQAAGGRAGYAFEEQFEPPGT